MTNNVVNYSAIATHSSQIKDGKDEPFYQLNLSCIAKHNRKLTSKYTNTFVCLCNAIWKMSSYVLCPRRLLFISLKVKTWNKHDTYMLSEKQESSPGQWKTRCCRPLLFLKDNSISSNVRSSFFYQNMPPQFTLNITAFLLTECEGTWSMHQVCI